MQYWLYLLFIGIAISMYFIPQKGYDFLVRVFSFGDIGIRKVNRRHDYVDGFANLLLLITIVLSLFHFEIPYGNIGFAVAFWFSFLCAFSQLHRVTSAETKKNQLILKYAFYILAVCCFIASNGVTHSFVSDTTQFVNDLHSNRVFSVFYVLSHHEIMIVFLQTMLYIFSFYCMWAQFKFIRLEDTYKANSVLFFCIKMAFLSIFVLLISYFGYDFIHMAYFVSDVNV